MRTFICNIVPDQLIVKLKAPQAANNFCSNLIDSNCFKNTLSIIPISYYDNNIKDGKKIKYLYKKNISNKYLKYISFFISNIRCAWRARNSENIWFYNLCKANFICYIILRFILCKKVFVILLDYTPSCSKSNIQYYLPFLYSKSAGIISLSQRTCIVHKNMLYKAGIITLDKIKELHLYTVQKKLKFLFSGNLDSHTGFPMALKVFKQLPDCELYISGNGNIDFDDIAPYKNIHYFGYLPYNEYLKLYENIDICLSFRNPEYKENENNFPSKILEYFCYGKIVLSTINYPEIANFNFLHCSFNELEIIKKITEIQTYDIKTLNSYKDNTENLKTYFSGDSWIKILSEIEKL